MRPDLKELLQKKLNDNNFRHANATQEVVFTEGREYKQIDLSIIDPNPYQPRRIFPDSEIEQLASSIAEIGLIEPVLMRQVGDRYQLAAGERRVRAFKLLNKHAIEAIVTCISDSDMAVFAIAENVDREDLSDFEICFALRKIENLFPTKKKLAESLGFNREDMYKYFAFDSLPPFMLRSLEINPRLISRAAATDIKRLINKENKLENFNEVLEEAWRLLVDGNMDQSKLTTYVKNKLKGFKNIGSGSVTDLIRKGKKIGGISVTEKDITIKINIDEITPEQENEIRNFFDDMIKEKNVDRD